MIQFRKDFLCCLDFLYRLQFWDEFSDRSNGMWSIQFQEGLWIVSATWMVPNGGEYEE
jgi:hypothetical protein